MTARPSLVRSIPFWILLVGSLASTVVGIWLVVDRIGTMNATLTDGSATGVEVYGGQAWVTLGAALVGAGLVGFVAALFLGVLRSFVRPAAVEVGAPVADELAYEPAVAMTDAAAPAAAYAPVADAPVAETPVSSAAEAPVSPAVDEPVFRATEAPMSPATEAPATDAPAGYTPAPSGPADDSATPR
ncbi:hypothetical protein G5T42_16150 [Microbacterium sp. 4R-513]|uniref:hypothetical protein n=1 Tax=Microbacterium sp. 4R-513 TaxID=2567934 RepID=UPI0013E10DB9|nr:hypothetical protein [Microbacterium sp. 4R-513]QIG40815.1 hypothetical protein G5T42_16150 [Microbacterium sp. 4R-513]